MRSLNLLISRGKRAKTKSAIEKWHILIKPYLSDKEVVIQLIENKLISLNQIDEILGDDEDIIKLFKK